jgi:uncharacterized protein
MGIKGRLAALAVVLCCLLGLATAAWALEPPAYKGYVNDYAHMLKPDTALQLEQALRSFDQKDSTQVAVLTIDSLEGDSLEDFSIRTVDKWKVGQKGKDNGVLLLIVKNDRKIRIEVGRGLEGVLTDLAAGRIVDNVIRPLFKEGRFDEGITAGAAAIIQTCRGEFTAEPRSTRQGRGRGSSPDMGYLVFGLFIISFLGRASRPLGMIAGAVLLPLAVFLGFSSFSLLLLFLLMPVGAMGGLLLPLIFSNMLMGGGGFGGGFGGGGDGGFGGFGGGGFGGGGASGGW